MSEWFPVSERLPGPGVSVLARWCERGEDFTDVACRLHPMMPGDYWYRQNGVEMLAPTYWMPLPEPPEVK